MSRLDSFIRRMEAQRACLDWAAAAIVDLPGPVFELGLGNGRTYNHLRSRLPDREIYVFDRRVKSHPEDVPPDDRLFLGEVPETLPQAVARFGRTVAMIHNDLSTGVQADNQALVDTIGPHLAQLLRPGGVIIADYQLNVAGWTALPEPEGVKPGRYYLYRAA